MRLSILLVVLVVCASLGVIPQPVSADDEWPDDDCSDAPLISSGTHSGTLTPGDFDLMRVDIPDGEYVEIEMTRSDDVLIELYQMTDSGYGGYQDVSVSGEAYFDGYDNIEVDFEESGDDNTATFRVYHEEDGEVYLPLTTQGSSGPADWSIQIAKNQPVDTPTPTPTATPTPTPTPTATPTPTPTPTATPTPTPTPTATDSAGDSTPSPTDDSGGSGDDIQDSDGDGVIDSEDYAPNDPEVQEKSDLQGTSGGAVPGFGVGIAIVALLIGTLVVLRRSD